MKHKLKATCAIWIAGAVAVVSGNISIGEFDNNISNNTLYTERTDVVYAATSSDDIQKDIDNANEKKETLEEEKAELEQSIKEIESEKKDALLYIEKLDEKLSEISIKINSNRKEIAKRRNQIRSLRKSRRKAVREQRKQYDTMKKRIKYMYENGSETYVELLFTSDSLADMFNRAEYINKVSAYDRNLLKRYKEIGREIERTKRNVEEKLAGLKELRQKLAYEKRSLNTLISKKNKQLERYKADIKSSEDAASDYAKMIAEQEKKVEDLLEEQRKAIAAEEAKRKEQESKNNTTSDKKNNESQDSKSENTTSADYCWPLSVSGTITSYFGYRDAPTEGASTYHKGIDISVPTGTSVLASREGTVVTSAYSASAGNYIALYHGNGVYSYYMHCSSLMASVGETVTKGQEIALSGSTGISTGPHLHFALYMNGDYVNPLDYVSR